MKKFVAILAAAVLAVSMTACSGSNGSSDTSKASSASSALSKAEIVVSDKSVDSESSAVSEDSSEKTEDSDKEEKSEQDSSKADSSAEPGEAVDISWFDDAVFVGDSVTLKLSYYAENGSLSDATFFCEGSLGWNNALQDLDAEDNVHPSYQGTKYRIPDGLKVIGANKIFIMLGMNDIGLYGVDGAITGMQKLMNEIDEACPDATIYIQSVTPMLVDSQLTDLNNTTIAEFNEKIQPVCQERGYIYLDVASAMDDGAGNLVYEYCGDPDAMGLHFSDEGCSVWVDYLVHHVK